MRRTECRVYRAQASGGKSGLQPLLCWLLLAATACGVMVWQDGHPGWSILYGGLALFSLAGLVISDIQRARVLRREAQGRRYAGKTPGGPGHDDHEFPVR